MKLFVPFSFANVTRLQIPWVQAGEKRGPHLWGWSGPRAHFRIGRPHIGAALLVQAEHGIRKHPISLRERCSESTTLWGG